MNTAVYYTPRGIRYHSTLTCAGFENGRATWDIDEHDSLPVHEVPVLDAIQAGRGPCRVCAPLFAKEWASSASGEDFGHYPVDVTLLGEPERVVCSRCEIVRGTARHVAGDIVLNAVISELVPWPCTSAIVLGLVPR